MLTCVYYRGILTVVNSSFTKGDEMKNKPRNELVRVHDLEALSMLDAIVASEQQINGRRGNGPMIAELIRKEFSRRFSAPTSFSVAEAQGEGTK
jgi:hypothetical protein